jgi:hypothetical protein
VTRNEFAIEGDLVWIKLTQGQETCVDLDDWPKVAPHRWHADKNTSGGFYARCRKTGILLHIALSVYLEVDHKDGNGLNNRGSNLRDATHQQNCRNRRSAGLYKGVSRDGKLWRARICDGTMKNACTYLGAFETAVEAAKAYDEKAKELFGEFARLNFPEGE